MQTLEPPNPEISWIILGIDLLTTKRIMTKERQIEALAKLDGWNEKPSPNASEAWGISCNKPIWNYYYQLPNYPESFDAIITLIQKQNIEIQWLTFYNLTEIVDAETPSYLGTPADYSKALLRAHGLWEE